MNRPTLALLLALAACESATVTQPSLSVRYKKDDGGGVPFSGPVSLAAGTWNTIRHNSTPIPLTSPGIGGPLSFDFPVGPDSNSAQTINYLWHPMSPAVSITGRTSVSVTLTVQTTSGTPKYQYDFQSGNTGPTPGTVYVLLWANRDGSGEFDRWWANPISYVLKDGTVTLTIPLTPAQWMSVYGKFGNLNTSTLASFNKALANVSSFNLTFGGGFYFGHGLNVSGGTVQFSLLDYSVL